MNASRIAAVLILGLTAWLAVEAWLLVAPVLRAELGFGNGRPNIPAAHHSAGTRHLVVAAVGWMRD